MSKYCVKNLIIGKECDLINVKNYLKVLDECVHNIDKDSKIEYINGDLWQVKNISNLYKAFEIVDFFNLSFDFLYDKNNIYLEDGGYYNRIDVISEISKELSNNNITKEQSTILINDWK